ncbi:MAG: right-handed parallel beta-helix repeat-containing protein [Planctomycetota bacterium]
MRRVEVRPSAGPALVAEHAVADLAHETFDVFVGEIRAGQNWACGCRKAGVIVPSGHNLCVSPEAILATTTDGFGFAFLPLPIPNDDYLMGANVYAQWLDGTPAWAPGGARRSESQRRSPAAGLRRERDVAAPSIEGSGHPGVPTVALDTLQLGATPMTCLRSLVTPLALASLAAAQVPIGGDVYDGNGGPLLAGVVYHASTHLQVPVGQTLTAQAGAIVKFNGQAFTVGGTLVTQGNAARPVVFTSIHDDTAGGDTNGNGNATLPAPNQWYGLIFEDGADASSLTHTIVRFTGIGYQPVVQLRRADIHATDCAFTDGNWGGLDLNNTAAPTITRCAIERCYNYPAVYGMPIDSVPGLVDLRVGKNAGGDFMRVDTPVLAGDVTIAADNCPGGALVLGTHLTVPVGTTLTLQAGVILKFNGTAATVQGTLIASGTAAAPVVLTSVHDDAAGGDTNGNGNATLPAPNQWYGLIFEDGADASSLTHAVVRYAGIGYQPVVQLRRADIHAADCSFTDGNWGGLDLNNTSAPTITRCAIERCYNYPAVYGVPIDSVPGFVDVAVADNAGGNFLRIDVPTLQGNVAIASHNCPGTALVLGGHLTVPVGTTLTLAPGVIFKSNGTIATVQGTLTAAGTADSPVIFTSIHDDAAGGDTNGNGNATVGGPNQWYGLVFEDGADNSTLVHTIVRDSGIGYMPAVRLQSADIVATDCTFSDGNWGGMDLTNTSAPTVTRCTIARCYNYPAIYGVPIGSVPGFVDETVTDNAGGNFLRIDAPVVSGNVEIRARNCPGGALVYTAHVSVPTGASLTLNPGVVFKAAGGLAWQVAGAMQVNGPVVFTSFADDQYGGDTNGNGASSGTPGEWYGIDFAAAAATSDVHLAIVRYTGIGYSPGIRCASPNVALRGARVEYGNWGGFALAAAAAADDLMAYGTQREGIALTGGNFVLRRATSAYQNGPGITKTAGFTGHVVGCIAWGNASGDFSGFATDEIDYSDGSGISGGVGNANVDPQFVNASTGDLRLQPGSTCIDAGDPLDTSTGLDPFGFPRYLDGNLDGHRRIDMGASEFDNLTLLVSGTPTPGSTLIFHTLGNVALNPVVLFIGAQPLLEWPLLHYGAFFVDVSRPYVALAWASPPSSVPVPIPATLQTPADLVVQEVGLLATYTAGNTSNPVRLNIW